MAEELKKRVTRKFTVEHDVCLLQEVLSVGGENAFLQPFTCEIWRKIAANMAKQHPRMEGLVGRGAKERAEKIIKDARAKENWRARQSGTDEQYGRKEAALVEAVSLFEEALAKKNEATEEIRSRQKKEEEMRSKALDMRNGAFATLKRKGGSESSMDGEDDVEPKAKLQKQAKTSSVSTMIDYLERKRVDDNTFRQQQHGLDKERFQASKEQRMSMLQVMGKMMDKLDK